MSSSQKRGLGGLTLETLGGLESWSREEELGLGFSFGGFVFFFFFDKKIVTTPEKGKKNNFSSTTSFPHL